MPREEHFNCLPNPWIWQRAAQTSAGRLELLTALKGSLCLRVLAMRILIEWYVVSLLWGILYALGSSVVGRSTDRGIGGDVEALDQQMESLLGDRMKNVSYIHPDT